MREQSPGAEAEGPVVVVAAGGTIETSFLPYRIFHLQADFVVQLRVALSPGALEFVTPTPLSALTGAPVYTASAQLDAGCRPLHLALSAADALLLWPATARVVAQCAAGQVTCPVTRLFAFTPKERVVVAPAIHPQMDRRLYVDHIARLRALGCSVLGGDDFFACWRDVLDHLPARLSLSRRAVALPRRG